VIRFSCPTCKARLLHGLADVKVMCPYCGQGIRVPTPDPSVPTRPLPAAGNPTKLGDWQAGPPPVANAYSSPTAPPPASPLPSEPPDVELMPAKGAGEKFCHECGAAIRARAEICPKCGVRQPARERRAPRPRARPRRVERVVIGPPDQCPECDSDALFFRETRMSQTGLIVLIVLLLFFFPLFWIGFLIRDEIGVCPDCGWRTPGAGGFNI
jgi:RNA polymerase subunit RPABC4/transcription elongation factor Spt4